MTRLLTKSDVAAVLTMADCVTAVEQVFCDYDAGRLPKPESLGVRATVGTYHVKAAQAGVFAAKVNANFPGNPARLGLPTIQGLIVVMDLESGTPLAVIDSSLITTMRTAAATAVAAKHLARKNAVAATVIGCGVQGHATVLALREVRSLQRVTLWDTDDRALEHGVRELDATGLDISRATSLESAVEDADIIVTCTPATQPFLKPRHVRPGVFVAAVGADNPQKCELTPELMALARVVADMAEQAATMGDLRHAIASGRMRLADLHGELGAVVGGRIPGRRSDDEIFVFDSTGTALQDVVVAAVALERATARGMGSLLSFA
jgi:alanine dehydrogenase